MTNASDELAMRRVSALGDGPEVAHRSADLEVLFADCFGREWNTCLEGGADEPLYRPGGPGEPHRLCYRADYFASALHETAHWCIAGPARRQCVDFGYWYEPDGRVATAQHAFEAVEARPQALEWIFSVAAGYPFRPSADNLGGGQQGVARLAQAIRAAVARYLAVGVPPRAARFADALAHAYGIGDWRGPAHYGLEPTR